MFLPFARQAFSLVELLVVLVILVAVAGLLVPLLTGIRISDASGQRAKSPEQITTEASMRHVLEAVMGSPQGQGYYSDMGALPDAVADLFVRPADADAFDPVVGLGWRGPYLLQQTGQYDGRFGPQYGASGTPTVVDGWGRPLVVQWPTVGTDTERKLYVRLVSAGPDGLLQTRADVLYPDPATDRGDDLVLFFRRADVEP
jgi:prepilin-type N-terminal cleavage/methylation domain-containing protein